MYTYIIIDDEPLVREGTIKKLSDLKEKATCIGQAENGQDGIALIEICHPDIVFLDMQMPVMDGTKLLPYLAEHYPDMPLIVISGFQDYNYMKQAITSKAVDYILKPFSRETVQKALLDAIAQIDSHVQLQNQIVTSEEKKELAYYEYDLELLTNLILGYHTAAPSLSSKRLSFIDDTHQLILLTLHFHESAPELSPQDFLEDNGFFDLALYLPYKENPLIGFMILFLPPQSSTDAKRFTSQIIRAFIPWYEQQNPGVSIGVSMCHDTLLQLYAAFQEASAALNRRLIAEEKSSCYFFEQAEGPHFILWDKQEEFLFRIEAGMIDEVERLLIELFDFYRKEPGLCLTDVKYHCSQLSGWCRNILNYYLNQSITSDSTSMQNIINCIFSLEELYHYYRNFFTNITNLLASQTIYSGEDVIEKIKFYVNRNYQKNLTLEFISSLFYLNRSYLSHLFRQKTGSKFVDYVNEVRIARAKELLISSDRKMYQIAKSVGYDNVKYFFRIFKKCTGLTPEQFRELNISDKSAD